MVIAHQLRPEWAAESTSNASFRGPDRRSVRISAGDATWAAKAYRDGAGQLRWFGGWMGIKRGLKMIFLGQNVAKSGSDFRKTLENKGGLGSFRRELSSGGTTWPRSSSIVWAVRAGLA